MVEILMSDNTRNIVNVEAEDSSKIVADKLAEQLGSNPNLLGMGIYDMRRLSVLNDDVRMALIYCYERGKQNPAFRSFFEQYLNLAVSTGGRGRRDIIRMELASRGGGTNVDAEIADRKPGWFGRNITRRNWELEEKQRLGID